LADASTTLTPFGAPRRINPLTFHAVLLKIVTVKIYMKYGFFRGGEISKMYTCARTSGFRKTLVRTNALLVRSFKNTKKKIFKKNGLINKIMINCNFHV